VPGGYVSSVKEHRQDCLCYAGIPDRFVWVTLGTYILHFHLSRLHYGCFMNSYSDLVDRLLIPFYQGDLLNEIHVVEGNNWNAKNRLDEATDEILFDKRPVSSPELAACVRAALYYLYDYADVARPLVKNIPDNNGYYWLAMIERRNGQFSIARQTLDKISHHAAYQEIHRRAGEKYDLYARQLSWDPFLFNNQCEQYKFGDTELKPQLRDIQKWEFETFFDDTWKKLMGKPVDEKDE